MQNSFPQNLLSTRDAARILGYTHDYISKLCRNGQLPARQVGNSWFIEPTALEVFRLAHDKRLDEYRNEASLRSKAATRKPTPGGSSRILTPARTLSPLAMGLFILFFASTFGAVLLNPQLLASSFASQKNPVLAASILPSLSEYFSNVAGGFSLLLNPRPIPIFHAQVPVYKGANATSTNSFTYATAPTYVTNNYFSGISASYLEARLALLGDSVVRKLSGLVVLHQSPSSGSTVDVSAIDGSTITNSTFSGSSVSATILTATTAVFTTASTSEATTTYLYVGSVMRGAGLSSCSGVGDKLLWNATTGQFSCGVDGGGSGTFAYDAWTHPSAGQSATTSLVLLNGNASTTAFSATSAFFGGTATSTFTSAGYLGIGSSSPWALLSVNPTAANGLSPAFAVGSSSATNFIVTNAGNVGIGSTSPTQKLSVTGNGQFSGHISIGSSASVDNTNLFSAPYTFSNGITYEENVTDMSKDYVEGFTNYMQLNPSIAPISYAYGVDTEIASAVGNSQNFPGIYGTYTTAAHAGTGVTDDLRALYASAFTYSVSSGTTTYASSIELSTDHWGSGTTTDAYGIRGGVANRGTGHLTNGYGIRINSAVNSGGGTFLNNYGLYIGDQSAAGSQNSYNLYSLGANSKNYFQGKIGIGTTSPFAKVSIHANNGETNTTLFAIGSSTATATSTLFTVRNNGIVSVTNSIGNYDSAGSFNSNISFGFANNGATTFGRTFSIKNRGGINVEWGVDGTDYGSFSSSGFNVQDSQVIGFALNSESAANTRLFRVAQGTVGLGGLANTITGTLAAERIGLGTTSPYAQLSVVATSTNGLGAPTMLFAIASTTGGTATSTLFSVNNSGVVNLNPGSTYSDLITWNGSRFLTASSTGFNYSLGSGALNAITSGSANIGIGYQALAGVTNGSDNVAIGKGAGDQITDLLGAIAIGTDAGGTWTSGGQGYGSVAIGHQTANLMTGSFTIAIGYKVGGAGSAHTGGYNIALGYTTFDASAGGTASANVMIGYSNASNLTSGTSNITLGYDSGDVMTTGSNNILIGNNVDTPATNTSNFLSLGNVLYGDLYLGNIGIGTTSPYAQLSIHAASTTGSLAPTTLFAIASSSQGTATTTHFVVTNTGNVGIGKANPTGSLDILTAVGGNISPISIENTTGAAEIKFTNNAGLISYIGSAGSAYSTAYASRTYVESYTTQGVSLISRTGDIRFYLGGVDASNERLRLSSAGNLGLGTTSPFAKLSVHANNGDTNTTLFAIGSSTASATTTHFVVRNTGYVGVGTANPSGDLHVLAPSGAGISRVISQLSGGKFVSLISGTAGNALQFESTGNFGIQAISTITDGSSSNFNQISFGASQNTAFGNLPYNPTDNGYRVDIQNPGTNGSFRVAGGISYFGGKVGVGSTSPFAQLAIHATSTTGVGVPTNLFLIASSSQGTATSTHFVVTNTGNVGIGTTTPQAMLDVYGNAYLGAAVGNYRLTATADSGSLRITGFNGNDASFVQFEPGPGITTLGGNVQANVNGASTGAVVNLQINGSTKLRVASNGLVGIGTTTPQVGQLSIASSTGPQLALSDGSLTSVHWTFRNSGGNLYLATASPSTFTMSPDTRFTITNTGNIGIGVTNPTDTFEVLGTNRFYGVGATTRYVSLGSTGGQPFINFVNADANDARITTDTNDLILAPASAIVRIYTGPTPSGSQKLSIGTQNSVYGTFGSTGYGLRTGTNLPMAFESPVVDINTDVFVFNHDASGGRYLFNIIENGIPLLTMPAGGGKLGIGSTSPYAQFSIVAASTTGQSVPTLFVIASSTNGTATTTHFVVTNAGNVGIGTSSPVTRLDVAGGNSRFRSDQNLNSYFETYGIHPDGRIGLRDAGGIPLFRSNGGSGTGSMTSFGPGSQITGYGLGGSIGFRSNGTPIIGGAVIGIDDFSGGTHKSLAIGTENVQPSSGYGATGIVDIGTVSLVSNTYSGQRPSIRLTGDALIFRTNTGTGSGNPGSEVMRIIGNSIGVGTSSPYAQLSIHAASTTGIGAPTTLFAIASSSQGNATTTHFVVTNTGNVGIGTTTPGTLLSLGDTGANTVNISATATSTFGSGINVRTGCYAVNGTCIGSFTNTIANGGTATTTFYNGGVVFYNSTLGTLSQASSQSGLYYDNTNNRLALGTTSPISQLTVWASTAGTQTTQKAFYTSAGVSSFSVPASVTSVTVKAWGAGGGGGIGADSTGVGGNGGGGGFAQSTITVTPGEALVVQIGTGGIKGVATTDGGYGGGYSAVKRSSTFLIQAGGGGGGGGSAAAAPNGGAGGAGGGTPAENGANSAGGNGGTGATASVAGTGGFGGSTGFDGSNGAQNAGGNGSVNASSTCGSNATGCGGSAGTTANGGGGGGGGGAYGGGGGESGAGGDTGGGGGGGGSSLVTGTATTETTGSGTTPGNSGDSDYGGNAGLGGTGAASVASATAGADGRIVISYSIAVPSAAGLAQFVNSGSTTALFVSDNGNVGIGTTSPKQIFHIDQDGGGVFLNTVSTGQRFNLLFGSAGINKWGISKTATDALAIYDYAGTGEQAVTVLPGGNVGIGTTSPYARFAVSTSSPAAGALPLFVVASSSNEAIFSVLGNGEVHFGLPANPTLQSSANLVLEGGNNRSYITYNSSGNNFNIGVGGQTINVFNVSGNNADVVLQGASAGGSGAGGTLTLKGGAPSSGGTNLAGSNITIAGGAASGNAVGGNIIFQTSAQGVSGTALQTLTERARFDASGNLGIGTSTPKWILTLASSTAPQLALTDASLTSDHWTMRSINGNFYIATASPATFATSSDTRFTVANSGNIGIGSTSPSATLSINTVSNRTPLNIFGYSIDSNQPSGVNSPLIDLSGIWNTTSSASAYSQTAIRLNLTNTQSGSGSYLVDLKVNGTSVFTVVPSGGIGSGNSVFAGDFRVGGIAQSATGAIFGNTTYIPSNGLINFSSISAGSDPRTSPYVSISRVNANTIGIGNGTAGSIIGTIAAERLGLGTSSPYALLSVTATSTTGVGAPLVLFAISSTTAGTATTTHLVVTNTGSVGIGTTSPWRSLSVTGTVAFDGLTGSATGNALCITAGKEVTDAGGGTCTPSSIRFKENVSTLPNRYALDTFSKLRVVSFDYKKGAYSPEDSPHSYGFIAEDVALVDPLLVDYGYDGQPLTLRFEKITGLTVQAIQELNLNLETLASTTASSTPASRSFAEAFFARLVAWFADATNGIGTLVANTFSAKERICVDDQCLTKEDIRALLQLVGNTNAGNTTPVPTNTTPPPSDTGTISPPNPAPEPLPDTNGTPETVPPPIDVPPSEPVPSSSAEAPLPTPAT